MSEIELVSGAPVPPDGSHKALKENGQQQDYVVLSADERAKGFVKRYRDKYVHNKCGVETRMGTAIAETYARNPNFYSGTFCVSCREHFPLAQFVWSDGEPMEPSMQAAWAEQQAALARERRNKRIADLRAELANLEAENAT
jgi:hypothetical protein